MRTQVVLFAGVGILLAGVSSAHAVFANSLTASQFVTPFGSGSVVGAPDGGGLWLGDTFDPPANPGFIVVQFSTSLFDGPGVDLQVYDVGSSADEVANISVSNDGVIFTPVGSINAIANTLDISGGFAGPFSYVRVANGSTLHSIDVDAIEAFHVPEPASMTALFAAGCMLRRRR
jgi:hypothetical protein